MQKVVKTILWIIAILLLVVSVALAFIFLTFDPNDYKDELAALVNEKTGRELLIHEDFHLTLYPWLGIELGALELGNAPGFGPQPFAKLESAAVKVRLLPLLKGKVDMAKVRLTGMEINLGQDLSGKTNWDDLLQATAPKEETAPPPPVEAEPLPIHALAIGGVEIRNARLTWDDRASGAHYALQNLNMETGALRLDQPISLSLKTGFESKQPALKGQVDISTRALANLEGQYYTLQDLRVNTKVDGAAVPQGHMEAKLQAEVTADLNKQTLNLPKFNLDIYGLNLQGKILGTHIIEAPQLSGELAVAPFNARDLLSALTGKAPETADPKAMTAVTLNLPFKADKNSLALNDFTLILDNTTLKGKVKLSQFDKPALQLALHIDDIDADRYLAPTTEAATPATAAAGAGTLPLETLRALNVNGQIKVDKIKIFDVRAESLQLALNAKDGLIQAQPLSARLYEGQYSGGMRLDVRGATPQLAMDETLTKLNLGPLVKDVLGEDLVFGLGTVTAKLTTKGHTLDEWMAGLNGRAAFDVANGGVNGINLTKAISEDYVKYVTKITTEEKAKNQTVFQQFSGTATLTNGVAHTDDLTVKSPQLSALGKGDTDLVKKTLDMRLNVKVEGELAKQLKELQGINIPVSVQGPFATPKIKTDLEKVIRDVAKAKVKAETQKAIEQQREELKKKTEEQLQKKLKSIFNR